MSRFDIERVSWSAPRIVGTRRGRRRIRTWKIEDDSGFWHEWDSGILKQRGYTISKWNNVDWTVTEWRLPNGEREDSTLAATAAAEQSVRAESALNAVQLELPAHLLPAWREIEAIYNEIEAETGDSFRFQFPSIIRLAVALEAFDGGLDASDTGVGKTAVACAVARLLGRDLFVICPKNVIPPWERMARRFGVRLWAINYESLRTGNTEFGYWDPESRARRFIYEGVNQERKLFVFDECHRMKDSRTLNCALGISALETGYKVLALSATAADNPLNMKFVALLTGLIATPNHYYGWMLHNGVRKGRFGLEFVGGRGIISQIHRQIFPLHGSRIRITDLGDLFPSTRVISEAVQLVSISRDLADEAEVHTLDPTKAVELIYREMRAEIRELDATRASDHGMNVLTAQLRARQRVELMKVPTFLEMANDGLEEGMSVVVVLNYSASITALARRWRTTNVFVGDTPDDQREGIIERFNDDEDPKLVMNIKCGGVGIGLQGTRSGRPRLALLSPTFSGPDIKQAIGRFPRAAGAPCTIKLVWAAGTVEEDANDRVRERLQRVSIFNDGIPDELLVI